ncbi:PAS domain-containing sensor histidine kinase [Reichenbachiella carrageenanivorans]|uniref:histidine kinase n=1 Tax=Reichenbachiella carrageenanivorans TaxID=2979869 RepID=A0ABY6D0L4_9BACT|nr:PAS domain-containing sensor histidine kinase [Reichenbachiella carrageenanivorans]UXX78598.1 PAS domain-containing sensor histidine kinase [Reichenbachiella carrageenanivorans]
MRVLRNLIRYLLNAGVYGNTQIVERRRIRLVNTFNLIGFMILLLFSGINLFVGSYENAIVIFTGVFFLSLPVHLLNSHGKRQLAKYYFVIVTLAFTNVMGYKTILEFQNRDNEYFFIGFSAVIIALFDNPVKRMVFIFSAFSAILMKLVRLSYQEQLTENTDSWLSITNLLVAFVCVYFFTDIFKQDLIRGEQRIRKFAGQLEKQKRLVQSERDELQYNKQLLRMTLDNLPIFITMMDITGKFLIVNSRFKDIVKDKTNEIEGQHYSKILGEDITRETDPLFERSVNGLVSEVNRALTFPSGETIHAYGKYYPLKNEKGEITHILAYVTDIQHLKETEKELIAVNEAKDKILSILSHDLRSPLHSLSGLITYSKDIDPATFDQLMSNVKRQVDTLGFTLDNVLSWVKTQLEGFVANPKTINTKEVVEESISLYAEQVKEKNIGITIKARDSAQAWVDEDHLSIVVRNLISNAIKFTPAQGHIEVLIETNESQVILTIKDSGIGMCSKTIDLALRGLSNEKPQSRPGTNGEKGTGLGLSFCLDLLQLNQATIEIQSEPDRGTTTVIHLPKVVA